MLKCENLCCLELRRQDHNNKLNDCQHTEDCQEETEVLWKWVQTETLHPSHLGVPEGWGRAALRIRSHHQPEDRTGSSVRGERRISDKVQGDLNLLPTNSPSPLKAITSSHCPKPSTLHEPHQPLPGSQGSCPWSRAFHQWAQASSFPILRREAKSHEPRTLLAQPQKG